MSRMGNEINRLRKEIGMTQKQLAKLVGVSEGFIQEIESGKRIVGSDLSIKISKALRQEVGKLDLYDTEEIIKKPEPKKNVVKVIEKPVQAIWSDALGGVLMPVHVYTYKMDKVLETKQLPIVSNKVEGFPKDKVLYLKIEDNDMLGFRICKGDLALAVNTGEVDKDAVYFIEYKDERVIRQIKKLEGDRMLLVSNSGSLATQMATKKDIKIIAKLVRLEIML